MDLASDLSIRTELKKAGKKNMLTSIDVKFIFDSARLGLFSSADILQIADVVLRVVFAMFSAIISPSSYSWNEWNVRHF